MLLGVASIALVVAVLMVPSVHWLVPMRVLFYIRSCVSSLKRVSLVVRAEIVRLRMCVVRIAPHVLSAQREGNVPMATACSFMVARPSLSGGNRVLALGFVLRTWMDCCTKHSSWHHHISLYPATYHTVTIKQCITFIPRCQLSAFIAEPFTHRCIHKLVTHACKTTAGVYCCPLRE